MSTILNLKFGLTCGAMMILTGLPLVTQGSKSIDVCSPEPVDFSTNPTAGSVESQQLYLPLIPRDSLDSCNDEFMDTSLKPCWQWINEAPTSWSLNDRPGFMRLISHSGYVGEQNLLAQSPPNGDYEIRTRLLFPATHNFQIAGLVVYADEDNYLLLGRAYCDPPRAVCLGNGIYFDRVENGEFIGSNYGTAISSPDQVYLRLIQRSGEFRALISENGHDWTWIGSHTPDPTIASGQVGLTTANDLVDAAIPADFDFFHVEKLPAAAEVVFKNATILTMEPGSTQASTIAITNVYVQSVGDKVVLQVMRGPDTQVIDLNGKTMLPGFVDAHTHLFASASFWGRDLETIQDLALQSGLTTVGKLYTSQEQLKEMQALAAAGKLRMRMNMYLSVTDACGQLQGDWYQQYPPTDIPGDMLRVSGIKIFTDGGSCGFPAFSYDHPLFGYGDLWFTQQQLDNLLATVDGLGYQAAIHALGDRAVDQVLNAIDNLLDGSPNTRRHRIEHNGVVRDDQLSRYQEVGAVPLIFGSYSCSFSAEPLTEYAGWEWRWPDLLDANPGVNFVYHSDTPAVGPVSPLQNLYSMVTDYEVDKDGVTMCDTPDFLLHKRLSVAQVLPMMTLNSAYALFRDDEIGSLKSGKFADLVILSDNPMTVDPLEIKDLQVLMTMVAGKVEYCAPDQSAFCPQEIRK